MFGSKNGYPIHLSLGSVFLQRLWPHASRQNMDCTFPSYGSSNTGWWFGTFFIFPYIGLLIIPIDEVIFFRGVALAQQPVICLWHFPQFKRALRDQQILKIISAIFYPVKSRVPAVWSPYFADVPNHQHLYPNPRWNAPQAPTGHISRVPLGKCLLKVISLPT